MTHAEAKVILSAHRPDGSDAGDPAFAEALRMAETDSLLGKWFAAQQAFDRAMTAKLGSIQPPAGLRSAILAGEPARGAARPAWWQQPAWLAMAAGFLVLLTVGLLLWPKKVAGDSPFMAFVANDAQHSELHGGKGEPAGELQARLGLPTTKLGDGLPVNFDTLRNTGCRAISFKGHEVLEVCFKRDTHWFHCYIVRHSDFPALAMVATPAITEWGKVDMATWSDSAHVYLVAGDAGLDALRRLL